MKHSEMRNLVQMDTKRWNNGSEFQLYIRRAEYRLIWRYRHLKYYQTHKLMRPLYLLERFLYHRSCVRCGCDIPSHVTMGGGVKIVHGWGIVINSQTVIGENLTILSGTVIGASHTGVPTLGSNVSLGAHALVIGGVSVGDYAEIGAGAIVTHNVPAHGVVYGEASPVRKIREAAEE